MITSGSARRRWFAVLGLLVAAAPLARAQQSCTVASTPGSYPSPLDAPVSLHARDVALREALDRVSASSRVPLAYSGDLLPLDSRVCVIAGAAPLGRVLDALLAGTGAEANVVAGRVVLAPRVTLSARESAPRSVNVLDRVIITGSAVAAPRRPLTIGVEIIDGETLRRQSLGNLADILNVGVPGIWVWQSSPTGLLAQYGGVRGASSFGASSPKIYIDGVEVANPLLMSQLNPDVVDRVEIIRGPQGSALYGSDAISGVINVLTRHDGTQSAGGRLHVASSAGAGSSAFGQSLVPTHDQRLAVRLGSNLQSLGVAAEFGQSGDIFPSSDTRQVTLMADARLVGARTTLTSSARFFDKRAGSGQNPLLSNLADSAGDQAAVTTSRDLTPQSIRQYTIGTTGSLATDGPWTHSLLVGADGYRLDHVSSNPGPYPLAADSALQAAQGSGDRFTIRGSTVGRFGEPGVAGASVTLGVEQSVLRLVTPVSYLHEMLIGEGLTVPVDILAESWNHNTGVFSQVNAAWRNRVFASAGLRVEHNDAFSGRNRTPMLPMLGVAAIHDVGDASLKLRAAYGKGIRPPQTPARSAYMSGGAGYSLRAVLDPEEQSGTEVGAELYFGRRVALHVTRFDQLASGLIQNVSVGMDTLERAGRTERRVHYQLQNVGEIGNHGWELQGTVTEGQLSLASALTFVDSRVKAVAPGYLGDLRAGDRMLGVPARTASVTASWAATQWHGTVSAARAADWVNYDRLALSRNFLATDGPPATELVGASLRSYWRKYDGETHVRVSGGRMLGRGVELQLTVDNLLGGQLGEPDNVTIRPGRTVIGGVTAAF